VSAVDRTDILVELQADILRKEGLKAVNNPSLDWGLGIIKNAFPNRSFPLGCVHEFLAAGTEASSATNGFIAGLLSSVMSNNGTSFWISSSRKLFPPALKNFGVEPDRFIFIDLRNEKEVIWAMEESLKCGALASVIGEVSELSFTTSRRLQLAVEKSQVTGFILRSNYRKLNPTACVTRWKITPLPTEIIDDLPGIGFPKWRVELLKVRNGKPGAWEIQWSDGRFGPIYKLSSSSDELRIANESMDYASSHVPLIASSGKG
jgi:protein ImuA